MYLFVYGSLRKGLVNSNKLENAAYLGVYKTALPYYMIGLKSKAYPYVVHDKIHDSLESAQITGELYNVTRSTLDEIDRMEGHPHSYTRRSIDVYNPEHPHKTQKAYMYILENVEMIQDILPGIGKRFIGIPHGDWKHFVE